MKINLIIVTYGERFHLLEKTLNAVMYDKNVCKIILVDNGSLNRTEIDSYIEKDKNKKIILIRNDNNEGSAGGFRKGIIEAQKNISDYVLLLDDDNVMEDNWSKYFIDKLNQFHDKDKVVLQGKRGINFNSQNIPLKNKKIFKIDYLSLDRIRKLIYKTKINKIEIPQPMVYMPYGACRYGGTLLPYKSILETEPPFEKFFLYADDAEYLFRISENGYKTYQLDRPIIDDIDHTFSDGYLFLTSFDKRVSLIKLFFMTRNQYALSLLTRSQTKLSIIINGIIGISSKIIYAFIKLGINKFTIERSKIIILAFYDGVRLKFNNDENIKKYTR